MTFIISVTNQAPNWHVIDSLAVTFRQSQKSFIVTKVTDYNPNDNTVTAATKGGTLREALTDAGPNDHITFDILSPTPGVAQYPAVIHLQYPITLNNNVTFDGPRRGQSHDQR